MTIGDYPQSGSALKHPTHGDLELPGSGDMRRVIVGAGNSEIPRYSMVIQWSDDDDAFLVTLPEWAGHIFNPVGHGSTYTEAAESGRITIEQMVSIALEKDWPLPSPAFYEVPPGD